MNDRVGTLSLAGLHQFFSSGFLSREDSSVGPGGFSILLCQPKGATSGPTAFKRDKAYVREYIGLDAGDKMIRYTLKKEHLSPSMSTT
jgi:hypothetical protein